MSQVEKRADDRLRSQAVTLPVYAFAMVLVGTPADLPAPVPVIQVVPAPTPTAEPPPASEFPEIDIVVTARSDRGDPLQAVNAQSFAASQAVDDAIIAPVSMAYRDVLPRPVRDGIHNFLNNVQNPIVFVNYLLQLKPGKAAETLGRFLINTTIGVAGIFDIAKRRPIRLPHRPNSFANTLGYYGVKPGPFFFLPVIGPTTLRDLVGITVDRLILPTAIGRPFNSTTYTLPVGILSALDYRVAFDEKLDTLRAQPDPYAASRRYYLLRRQAEIARLHSPAWRARQPVAPPSMPAPVPAPVTEKPAAPISPK